MPTRDCPEKRISLKMAGQVLFTAICIAGPILAYYITSEGGQNTKITDIATSSAKVESSLAMHIEHSTEAFKSLEVAMGEQRKLTRSTRETLSAVNATQRAIKSESGRLARSIEALAKEVRRANGRATP